MANQKLKLHKTLGYICPPSNKQQAMKGGLKFAPLPNRLYFNPGAAEIVVRQNQQILKGEIIAICNDNYRVETIVAPTSGTITSTKQFYPIMHTANSELTTIPQIVLEPDGRDQWRPRTFIDIESLSHSQLVDIVHRAGIIGMGGAGFPTAVKLQVAKGVKTIIINAAECEPYICCDQQMLAHYAQDVVLGAQLLASILGDKVNVKIAIEDNMPESIASLNSVINADRSYSNIELVIIPTRYPSGSEKQLIQIVTGQLLPNGKLPINIDIIVFNAATTKAIWDAVALDKPCVERVVTATGNALNQQANYVAAIGTPASELLKACGFYQLVENRVIAGGPLMGHTLSSIMTPLLKTNNCVIAPTLDEMPLPQKEQPCIQCGDCADVCPANLLPQQLYWHSKGKDYEGAEQLNLFDCIECGACAYVCPSHIPLVQYYRHSKSVIRERRSEKIKADRARLRFESRKSRIAQLEQERLAKRQARILEVSKVQVTKAEDVVSPFIDEQQRLELQKQRLQEKITNLNKQLQGIELTKNQRLHIESQIKNTQRRLSRIIH